MLEIMEMASDFEKPNKVHTLFDYEVKKKMWPLKVDDLFMVGKSSSKKLHELNINTVEDLIGKSEEDMMKVRNLGRKSLDEVVAKLGSLGFGLAKDED